jgi:hypothetical protein
MGAMTPWTTGLMMAAAVLLVGAVPALAQDPDAMLYELNEDMRQTSTHRQATSSLSGFAAVNTPLCTAEFVTPAGHCVVNATGSNNVDMSTALGPVHGDFTIVTQEPMTVDIEEVVRRRGNFRGQIDISRAAFGLATMDGSMTAEGQRGSAGFRGVFRLPFLCGPEVYCYMSSGPDATPRGPVPLMPHEFALGYPMVRLDIYFE